MCRRPVSSATCAMLVLFVAAGCAATPLEPVAAANLLAVAEAAEQAGDHDAALEALDGLVELNCPKRLRDRRDMLRAQAELHRGEPWRAFLALEHFADDHPHSELRAQAVEMIWQIAEVLRQRDGGFLIFWSDRTDARTVLEHLVSRHPDTPRLDDALRILGDMSFADGDYDLAQERYQDIILNRPESAWSHYAQFRFAMSLVARLQGPDYDLDAMQRADNELARFLEQKHENPQMVEETSAALLQVREWQVERHLGIAEFYRTVGNLPGELHHLQRATAPEFAEAPSFPAADELRRHAELRAPDGEAAAPGGRP
ncbi:MAG: outer membrane protein assembly factor BamD [Planctomycetes bacterium]|nr:outer membrane protein assembly factor BamD [Planctomycetota bacterium]